MIWGTGTPRREFLHVDDCADALVHLMKVYSRREHINVGSGEDLTILELAGPGRPRSWASRAGSCSDLTKPDGTPRKLMSGEKLRALGWQPSSGCATGLPAPTAHTWTGTVALALVASDVSSRHRVGRTSSLSKSWTSSSDDTR